MWAWLEGCLCCACCHQFKAQLDRIEKKIDALSNDDAALKQLAKDLKKATDPLAKAVKDNQPKGD